MLRLFIEALGQFSARNVAKVPFKDCKSKPSQDFRPASSWKTRYCSNLPFKLHSASSSSAFGVHHKKRSFSSNGLPASSTACAKTRPTCSADPRVTDSNKIRMVSPRSAGFLFAKSSCCANRFLRKAWYNALPCKNWTWPRGTFSRNHAWKELSDASAVASALKSTDRSLQMAGASSGMWSGAMSAKVFKWGMTPSRQVLTCDCKHSRVMYLTKAFSVSVQSLGVFA